MTNAHELITKDITSLNLLSFALIQGDQSPEPCRLLLCFDALKTVVSRVLLTFHCFFSFVVRTVCSLQERCQFFSKYNCQGSVMYLLTWCLCAWTSLISVVTLLKVTLNTEFTNTELLLQGEIQIKFLWASGYKIFIRQ